MHGLLPAATVVSAPQFPQNFTFAGFIVPHFGQARICCCCGGCATMPPLWEPMAYPLPMPAPRPTPVPAGAEGFAAAALLGAPEGDRREAPAVGRPTAFS